MDIGIYIEKCQINDKIVYCDNRWGNIIPEEKLHEKYKKYISIKVKPVVKIINIIRSDNSFYLLLETENNIILQNIVIYNDRLHFFIVREYTPWDIISYILNKEEFNEYFKLLNHPIYTKEIEKLYLTVRELKIISVRKKMVQCRKKIDEGINYSPDNHSPDNHSPDNHSPDNHSPDDHSPDNHSPDNHSPDDHSPDNHSPDNHSPDNHSPDDHSGQDSNNEEENISEKNATENSSEEEENISEKNVTESCSEEENYFGRSSNGRTPLNKYDTQKKVTISYNDYFSANHLLEEKKRKMRELFDIKRRILSLDISLKKKKKIFEILNSNDDEENEFFQFNTGTDNKDDEVAESVEIPKLPEREDNLCVSFVKFIEIPNLVEEKERNLKQQENIETIFM